MIDEVKILHAAFDSTGVKFHDRATALAELKADGRDIAIADDGTATIHFDGETLELSQALLRFAYDRRDLVDGRTLPREGVGKARPGTLAKSDMTLSDKVAFIKAHGEDAFSRLPLVGVGSKEVKTKADWYKLPVTEKSRRLKADPEAFNKLAKAPAASVITSPMTSIPGGRVNYELLERQRRIRPS